MIKHIIYGLIDPNTDELRYIGYTSHPTKRLKDHCKERGRTHKIRWIQSLIKNGQTPEMYIIEEHQTAEALPQAEIDLIAYYRYIGCNLTNFGDGGIGGWLGQKHSDETKQKMSENHADISGDNNPKYWKGKTIPQSVIDKRVAARIGRPLSEEHRLAISEGNKGKHLSAEHKAAFLGARTLKLSQADAEQIRTEYKRGNGHILAKRYGVCGAMISNIVHNKVWKQ